MIDNFSLIFFSGLIIYVVLKAVKLDKMIPWFSDKPEVSSGTSPDKFSSDKKI